MKNLSLERGSLVKHLKSSFSFYIVRYCYIFPQIHCSWTGVKGFKKDTHFHWLWFKIISKHVR